MEYKYLFIFVEGDDDERFFMEIFKAKIEKGYKSVIIKKYACEKIEKMNNYLKSIECMGGTYFFLTDINSAPCIAAKKQKIKDKYKNVNEDKIIVVIKEIESWYLAGLDDSSFRELRIRPLNNTNDITKEKFNQMIPEKYGSRINFMREILKRFSVDIAKQKNGSFRYFYEKVGCE